ncbi:MAG: hypothetical protein L6Q84_21545 [Polyangiaceae bacterium]|nr:hypothetical protein [Polyangiaceae bacterium]
MDQDFVDTPTGELRALTRAPLDVGLWDGNPPRVAIAHPDAGAAAEVAGVFERTGCSARVCSALDPLLAVLAEQGADIVVLHARLEGGPPERACERLRESDFGGGIIVLADGADARAGRLARLGGADDVVDPAALADVVTSAVPLARRIRGRVTRPPAAASGAPPPGQPPSSPPATPATLAWAEISATLAEHAGEIETGLTSAQCAMFDLLRAEQGRIVGYAPLGFAGFGNHKTAISTLSSSMRAIRTALEPHGVTVRNRRRRGYCLALLSPAPAA